MPGGVGTGMAYCTLMTEQVSWFQRTKPLLQRLCSPERMVNRMRLA